MKKYYKVLISKTGKIFGSKEGYNFFDESENSFATIKEAKQFIKENYSGHKKEKMFCDYKDGSTRQVGWIYSFVNADYSHSPIEKWYQRDWIEIKEVKETTII